MIANVEFLIADFFLLLLRRETNREWKVYRPVLEHWLLTFRVIPVPTELTGQYPDWKKSYWTSSSHQMSNLYEIFSAIITVIQIRKINIPCVTKNTCEFYKDLLSQYVTTSLCVAYFPVQYVILWRFTRDSNLKLNYNFYFLKWHIICTKIYI